MGTWLRDSTIIPGQRGLQEEARAQFTEQPGFITRDVASQCPVQMISTTVLQLHNKGTSQGYHSDGEES
jgi:hypothetical protein